MEKCELMVPVAMGDSYDVVVCGGGTAGCVAAIAAARAGASVLMLERTFTPGGMLTLGNAGITKYIEHCRDVEVYKREVLDVLGTDPEKVQVAGGIAREYADRMIRAGGALGTHGQAGSYVFADRYAAQFTLMDMLDEAGVRVLYGTVVVSAVMNDGEIVGVVAHNKQGFTQFLARRVVDATGDADVAALCGVPCNCGVTETDIKEGCGDYLGQMMQFGTMFRVDGVDFKALFDYLERNPDRYYVQEFGVMSLENARESHETGQMAVFRIWVDDAEGNRHPMQVYNMPQGQEAVLLGHGCGTQGDGLNARSVSEGQHIIFRGVRALVDCLRKVPGFERAHVAFIPDVGVRETRHIVGEYTMTGLDVISARDFPDSIGRGGHPIDVHPLPKEVEHMDMNHWSFSIPYRSLVPLKVDNLLVAGRSISATRMASGSIRPTVQCMVIGEAAGTAAAMSIQANVSPRALDVAALQRALCEAGGVL